MAIRILSSENIKGQLNVKDTQDTVFDSGLSVTRSLTTQTGYINIVGGAFNFNAPASISTKFRSNGNELIRIESDGDFWLRQVGKKLYFQNSAGAAPYIKNSGEDASTTPYGRNLEFYTDSYKRIEIDYAGTTTFDSGSNNVVAVFKSTDIETQVNFVDSTGFASIRSRNDLRFYVGGSSLIRAMDIADDGNVGIGTASPDLGGGVAGTRVLTIASPTAERWGILELAGNRTWGGNQVGELKFISTDATNNGVLVSLTAINDPTATGTGGSLKFSTRPNGGTLTERMRIDSDGNVGIGVTPWVSTLPNTVIDINPVASIWGYVNSVYLNSNAYYNNGWLYKSTAAAGVLQVDGDILRWRAAASGTADAGIAFDVPFIVDSGGNVGIGTTSPQRLLQLRSTNQATGIFLERTSNYGFVQYNEIVGSVETYHLGFVNNNTFSSDILVANESGNVGIGTDIPSQKLSIATNAITSNPEYIEFQDFGAGSNWAIGMDFGGLQWHTGDGTGIGPHLIAQIKVQNERNGAAAAGALVFSTAPYNTLMSERMRIKSNGNVGIGTSSPLKLLTVKKATSTNTIATSEVMRLAGTAQVVGNKNELGFANYDNNYNASVVIGAEIMSTAAYLKQDLYFATRDSTSDIAPTERMRITSDGKVVVQGENFVIDDVREHREEFVLNGNSAYNFDVDIKSIGASGQPFEVFVAFTHYSTGYGAAYHAAYYQRSTVQSDITLIHQYFNQNSTRGGTWTVTWLSATQIRISKSAGVGGSTGYGYLRVTQVDF